MTIYKIVNGVKSEMTPEEIADMQKQAAIAEVLEKSRPFTAEEVTAMLITAQINTLPVDDNTALRMAGYYPAWDVNVSYTAGFKVRYKERLWRCVQAHTSLTGWEPENAPSLWEGVNESHSGTMDDPIPYSGNMALEAGKYYIQNGTIYLCIRDTVNPVYNVLAELVGTYVEAL